MALTRRAVHIQGRAYTRPCTYKAVHTQGSAHKRRSVATTGVLLFKGGAGVSPASSEASRSPHTRRCLHKAVHTQGGAHKRRSVATAGVLLFKGGAGVSPASSEASVVHKAVLTQGGAYKRRSVATARDLLFKVGAGVSPAHKRRPVSTAGDAGAGVSPASSEVRRSPHTRPCIHKAVQIQGGAHTRRCTQRRYVATAGDLLFKVGAGVSPASSEVCRSPHTRPCIHKAVQIQGGAHKGGM